MTGEDAEERAARSPGQEDPPRAGDGTQSARPVEASQVGAGPAGLSEREVQVLRLVAMGLSNKEVAVDLGLSVHTVESHLHSIYGKLKVTTRGAAVRFAIDQGLV